MMLFTNHRHTSEASRATDPKQKPSVILGGELVLARAEGGAYIIHTFRDRGAHRLGRFETAAEAWQAIDELEADID